MGFAVANGAAAAAGLRADLGFGKGSCSSYSSSLSSSSSSSDPASSLSSSGCSSSSLSDSSVSSFFLRLAAALILAARCSV